MDMSRLEFLHCCNVANYRRILGETPDPACRETLLFLLKAESAAAKLHGWIARHVP